MEKHKDEMYVGAGAFVNGTAPSEPGIYIYRAVIDGAFDYEFEFPILVEPGGPIIGPINPKAPDMTCDFKRARLK